MAEFVLEGADSLAAVFERLRVWNSDFERQFSYRHGVSFLASNQMRTAAQEGILCSHFISTSYDSLADFLLDDEGDDLLVGSTIGCGCGDDVGIRVGGSSVGVGCCAAGCSGAARTVAAASDCREADREQKKQETGHPDGELAEAARTCGEEHQ